MWAIRHNFHSVTYLTYWRFLVSVTVASFSSAGSSWTLNSLGVSTVTTSVSSFCPLWHLMPHFNAPSAVSMLLLVAKVNLKTGETAAIVKDRCNNLLRSSRGQKSTETHILIAYLALFCIEGGKTDIETVNTITFTFPNAINPTSFAFWCHTGYMFWFWIQPAQDLPVKYKFQWLRDNSTFPLCSSTAETSLLDIVFRIFVYNLKQFTFRPILLCTSSYCLLNCFT